MGRFDALTQLDENPQPAKTLDSEPVGKGNKHAPPPLSEKPATRQAQNPAKQLRADVDKVEKYTTHLEPTLIKKIKLAAIEKDMNDYDVVKAALLQYFEKNT